MHITDWQIVAHCTDPGHKHLMLTLELKRSPPRSSMKLLFLVCEMPHSCIGS